MPIYEYRRPDGSTFEVLQSFSEEPLTHDPDTGVEVTRVLHAPAVHFKGSGFYNTDYGTRRRQRENQASAGEKSGSDGGGSAEGGSAEGGSGGEKSSAKESGSSPEGSKASKKPASGESKAAAGGSKKSAPVSA